MCGFETPEQLLKVHKEADLSDAARNLAVVIGLGEVGAPICEMLQDNYGSTVRGFDLRPPDPKRIMPRVEPGQRFRFMHVCFPQSPAFIPALQEYVKVYEPDYVIIHSTLSPGITVYIDSLFLAPVYYSPVRGNIKDGMRWSLEKYTKYIAALGYNDHKAIIEHLTGAGFKVEFTGDPTALEWAKILDLAWYGLNIAFYQEAERILEEESLEYSVVSNFITSTPRESEGKAPRSMFYGGYIGGHCVIQGIEKILAKKNIPMLRAIIDSNIKRQDELLANIPEHHPSRWWVDSLERRH